MQTQGETGLCTQRGLACLQPQQRFVVPSKLVCKQARREPESRSTLEYLIFDVEHAKIRVRFAYTTLTPQKYTAVENKTKVQYGGEVIQLHIEGPLTISKAGI